MWRSLTKFSVVLLITMLAVPVLAQQTTYTVRGGDTLASIAARYDVSLDALLVANGLTNPNTVFAGQVLVIPGETSFGTGGPLSNATTADVITAPVINATQPTAPAAPAAPLPTYTVQSGDSLTAIAARYGITTAQLVELNDIGFVNFITVGQVLTLPQGATVQFGTGGPAQPSVPAAQGPLPLQYTVVAGDIVDMLAQQYGTTVAEIAALNNLDNPSRIFPGDVLLIP